MKLIFSQLKKYIPSLDLDPKRVADIFTEIGYLQDGPIEEIQLNGNQDFVIDLEVRQNRADCFGVHGLARELAAYIGADLVFEDHNISTKNSGSLNVIVKDEDAVKRVLAVRISNLNITESPDWLKNYLEVYEINSINSLVDLTNYVMIETGHPSHAFDVKKSGESLTWEINPSYKEMTSLDGTVIDLTKDALVVSDGKRPLALAGLVGGDVAAIDKSTTDAIVEMAVYDGGLVRRNSRQMKIFTEASQRLEKFMDPKSLPESFDMLISMIIELCKGEIVTEVHDEVINNEEIDPIEVNLAKAEQIAGVNIPKEKALEYLIRLGFEISNQDQEVISVIRPVNRLDIEGEFDVFEEIIRMYGYYSLPSDYLPLQATKDVTPSHLILIDYIKDNLVTKGFDEVRTWVLVNEDMNSKSKITDWEMIHVENSINEEVPMLRQSLLPGLMSQLKIYNKKFINDILLFEIGKVFGKKDSQYEEHYALGVIIPGNDLQKIQKEITSVLNSIGVTEVLLEVDSSNSPEYAHPKTKYDLYISNGDTQNRIRVGKVFVINSNLGEKAVYAEIDINVVDDYICEMPAITTTAELQSKLVSLDITVSANSRSEIGNKVLQLLHGHRKYIWDWEIVDVYQNNYTVRVIYSNLTDPEAKQLHDKIFT
jgi:phenylalanyl-tRNA synthetase beta chain